MKIFLMDTENTCFAGFDGCKELTENDVLYVLHSNVFSNSKYSGELLMEALTCRAKFVEVKITPNARKNYLDMQLSTIVGAELERNKEAEAVIISKDGDYQAVIDYWKTKGRKVSKAESIALSLHPSATGTSKKAVTAKATEPAIEKKAETKQTVMVPVSDDKLAPVVVEVSKKEQKKAEAKKPSKEEIEEKYKADIAEILTKLFPDKKKASITKYSKAMAGKTTKKNLKSYCSSSFADDKHNWRVYSRVCKVFPYA